MLMRTRAYSVKTAAAESAVQHSQHARMRCSDIIPPNRGTGVRTRNRFTYIRTHEHEVFH